MATFEKYLRGIHENTAVRRHTLITNISPEGDLCFTIHPAGSSHDGELPRYSVKGNSVVNISDARPFGPVTPFEEARIAIEQAWALIATARNEGIKIGPYAANEFFAAQEEKITELIQKANNLLKQ